MKELFMHHPYLISVSFPTIILLILFFYWYKVNIIDYIKQEQRELQIGNIIYEIQMSKKNQKTTLPDHPCKNEDHWLWHIAKQIHNIKK